MLVLIFVFFIFIVSILSYLKNRIKQKEIELKQANDRIIQLEIQNNHKKMNDSLDWAPEI